MPRLPSTSPLHASTSTYLLTYLVTYLLTRSAKAAKHVPFACFYIDFSIGAFAVALFAFLTLGRGCMLLDAPGGVAGKVLAAFTAGAVFNVANVLLVAGISLAGGRWEVGR